MYVLTRLNTLEWVSDGEIECMEVAGALCVEEIARHTVVAGLVDAESPVKSYNEESQIITQSHASADGYVVEQS